jgi:hypothetical protein
MDDVGAARRDIDDEMKSGQTAMTSCVDRPAISAFFHWQAFRCPPAGVDSSAAATRIDI